VPYVSATGTRALWVGVAAAAILLVVGCVLLPIGFTQAQTTLQVRGSILLAIGLVDAVVVARAFRRAREFAGSESDATLLFWAARFRNKACVRMLLDNGADVAWRHPKTKETPLDVARTSSRCSSTAVADMLSDAGSERALGNVNEATSTLYETLEGVAGPLAAVLHPLTL